MSADRSSRATTSTSPERGLDLTSLYAAEYPRMVRLAAFLLGSAAHAEDLVQDAFVRVAASRIRESDKAAAYLRRAVVNACKAAVRHRRVVNRHAQTLSTTRHAPSAEDAAWSAFDRSSLVTALRRLPERKRQVVVLRHYCDLSEAAVADMLGISVGAVKSLTARGLADLARILESSA